MTPGDIIYQRRCHVIERAAIVGVARACREAGVSRTTYYRWTNRASRYGPRIVRSAIDLSLPAGRSRMERLVPRCFH